MESSTAPKRSREDLDTESVGKKIKTEEENENVKKFPVDLEKSVGLTHFLSDTPSISGILKHRFLSSIFLLFSDFWILLLMRLI